MSVDKGHNLGLEVCVLRFFFTNKSQKIVKCIELVSDKFSREEKRVREILIKLA